MKAKNNERYNVKALYPHWSGSDELGSEYIFLKDATFEHAIIEKAKNIIEHYLDFTNDEEIDHSEKFIEFLKTSPTPQEICDFIDKKENEDIFLRPEDDFKSSALNVIIEKVPAKACTFNKHKEMKLLNEGIKFAIDRHK